MKSILAQGYALAAFALVPFLTAQAATAGPGRGEEIMHVVVRYNDLDLSRHKDANRLYGRIERAARKACDNDPESDLHRLALYKQCMHQAVSSAVARVSSPQLTSIHQAAARRIGKMGG